MQFIISSLVDGEKNCNDLSSFNYAENTSSKEIVGQGFKDQTKSYLDRERCKTFLESLCFPKTLSKQEEISDAHEWTFEWIFDASGGTLRSFPGITLRNSLSKVKAYVGSTARQDQANQLW